MLFFSAPLRLCGEKECEERVFADIGMPQTFSISILLTLLLMLVASGRVFYVLNRQWTTHRPIEALREWARDRRYKIARPGDVSLPASLEGLKSLAPEVELILSRGLSMLVRVRTQSSKQIWNLLIHETQNSHVPSALRPVGAGQSYIDLFSLSGFPGILPPERFLLLANDARQARTLAESSARGLLPADIGLLLHGPYITLDFSNRPFDAIEFDRLLAIMDQVKQAI